MKKFANTLLAISLLTATALPAFAADKANAVLTGEATLKKIMDRSAPSETNNANVLIPLSGQWEYEATVWTGTSEPQKAFGSTTNKMILGNRFLSSTVAGNLNIEGIEVIVNGEGKIGYDNTKQSFNTVWTDSLSTGMMVGTAKYDEKTKTLTETGHFTNPVTGAEEKFRAETKFVDADNYERTVYATGKSGKEAKLMQFKYTKPGFAKAE